MSTEHETNESKKAMAYDLICLLEQAPDRTYTVEEIKQLIRAYVAGPSDK